MVDWVVWQRKQIIQFGVEKATVIVKEVSAAKEKRPVPH